MACAVLLAAGYGPIQVSSSDFSDGGTIPAAAMARDCGGANRSPQIAWSGVPHATKSFALIVHDPDAPVTGGFYHWVVYNLPAATLTLPANAKLDVKQLGETSAGSPGYYGPCPLPVPTHQ